MKHEKRERIEHAFTAAEIIAIEAIAWKHNAIVVPLQRQIDDAAAEHARHFATLMRAKGIDAAKIPAGARWVPGKPGTGEKTLVWEEAEQAAPAALVPTWTPAPPPPVT
jgi:hypothetical protein